MPDTQSALLTLTPGQQVTLSGAKAERLTLTAIEMENTLAWRQGRIVLDGLTIAEAAARLVEFHGRAIAVAPEVAALRLGGTFPLDDLSQFFAALKMMRGVQVVSRADGSFAIEAR